MDPPAMVLHCMPAGHAWPALQSSAQTSSGTPIGSTGRQMGTAVPPGVGSHWARGDLQEPAVQNGSIGCPPESLTIKHVVRPMQSTTLPQAEYIPSWGCSDGVSPELESPPVSVSVEPAPVPELVVFEPVSASPLVSVSLSAVVASVDEVSGAVAVALAVAENEVGRVAGSVPDAHAAAASRPTHVQRRTRRVCDGSLPRAKRVLTNRRRSRPPSPGPAP